MSTPAYSLAAPSGILYGGQAVPYPAWLDDMVVDEWHPIPGTASAFNLTAFCGFVFVGKQIYSPVPGGHTDSSYNGVVRLDLSLDNPVWNEINPPAAPGDIPPSSAPTSHYGLKPASRHTRFNGQYFPNLGRILMLGARDVWSQAGASFDSVDGFNLSTNEWDAAGTFPPVPGTVGIPAGSAYVDGGACLDPDGNGWTYGCTIKFDKVTQAWTRPLTATAANRVRYPWCRSLSLGLMFGLCWGNGWGAESGINAVKQVGNVQTQITFNASAATVQFAADIPSEAGMTFNEVGGYFLFYAHTRIYKIIPNLTSVWDMEIFAYGPGSTVLAAHAGGVQNKFQYVPDLHGYITLPTNASGLYFMKAP